MHENFIALEQEKRDRIINAAMREFASKGFKNASTNEIVKNSEISKGALFHYFSSKKDLYEFLHDYSLDFFITTMKPRIKELPTDVFKRWIAFAALKIEIATQYPDMADFMQRAFRENSQEFGGLFKDAFERFSAELSQKIYDGIDMSRFRPDIDIAKALQIIWWILEGFALSKQKALPKFSKIKTDDYINALTHEIEEYLVLLKKSFYKDEFWDL